eukprot:CAMPEP_0185200444 /NCGR_PEP_ID=MMETSP1140-20130426/47279_1 /TAXON_ID=298111 /ORGANISM="Pavlova sp., Strain CCMP459" /LENGTH=81 /DNA_ID=CAMNT_0027767783 /DNA_START=67 /DNA_END=309 /DNA_ORIENTATION=+
MKTLLRCAPRARRSSPHATGASRSSAYRPPGQTDAIIDRPLQGFSVSVVEGDLLAREFLDGTLTACLACAGWAATSTPATA